MALTFEFQANQHPATSEALEQILANPGFGQYFTDHMALAEYSHEKGWGDGEVVPYGPLAMDPATSVLHYAQEIFEGLKAYRHADGSVWMFRAAANALRFEKSARRLGLPLLASEDFVTACEELVRRDVRWVPSKEEESLYLRPFMIGSEPFLGVRGARTATFCVIASPAGHYFPGGLQPVNIWLTTDFIRAAPGGTGAAKCGGNYASSLLAQQQAYDHGCSQVLFLDGVERTWLEELGGMNIFLVKGDELITPELTGTILEGVTRSSILALAPQLGLTPVERKISLTELADDVNSGAINEMFACGTAAVVTPVGSVMGQHGTWKIGDQPGEVTLKIRDTLLGVQYGTIEDTFGWTHEVVSAPTKNVTVCC